MYVQLLKLAPWASWFLSRVSRPMDLLLKSHQVATAHYHVLMHNKHYELLGKIHCGYKACQGVFAHCKPGHTDAVFLEESEVV